MIKKFLLVISLTIGVSIASMVVGQTKAFACSNSVCGYFNDINESAWCNVLPDTSIRWGGYNSSWVWTTNYPSYCWLNTSRGNGHSRLYGDADPTSFKNDISAYLNEGSGTADFIRNSNVGAAFLVDDMLGIDRHNGNSGQGVADARANWGNWVARVDSLAVNQCSVSSQPTCPGKSFGINWAYTPPYFCGAPFYGNVSTSGYDPWIHDTPFYNSGGNCDHDWRASVPEIVFYWTDSGGVVRTFRIGSQCGNVQESGSILPKNNPPSGNLTLTCNPATATFTATATISDPDGATTGHIQVGALNAPVSSGVTNTVVIPQSDAGPFTPVTVILTARDVGPVGSGNEVTVDSASTASMIPCVNFSCGSLSLTPAPPSRTDPYMHFNLTVDIHNSASAPPPGATIAIQITPPAGASYNYSGSQAAVWDASSLSSKATFNNLGPTGKTGVYAVHWSMSGTGCDGTFPVVNLPYVNVYGGDVMAGASPTYNAGSSDCSAVAGDTGVNSGVFSWNNHSSGYTGAGAEYAVMALNQIADFSSALYSSNVEPYLSFADTYTPADPSKFTTGTAFMGGYFGDPTGLWTGSCDFTSDLTVSPTPGPLTIGPLSLNPGTETVKYVNNGSDVYINGDITYNGSAGWADASQIPVFKLIVAGGNIYINSNVQNLDGLFVAEPSAAGTGGVIYTCASAIGVPVTPPTAGYYTTCNKQLNINGAFVARQVQFGRTYGSLGQAPGDTSSTNHDAEVFHYSPELWLPRSSGTPDDGYAAITGLPPVL